MAISTDGVEKARFAGDFAYSSAMVWT